MARLENVVITGGAGAIGSRLVRRLLDDGAKSILIVDDLSSGYEWLLPDDDRIRLERRDVCELAYEFLDAPPNPAVFHLAAFFANQNSVDHPTADLHTNGLGTLTTLMWAVRIRASRLVYASAGCSIAGHNLDEPIREDMAVSLDLDTPYQITKALGEFYCNYFRQQVSTVRCRFFNSYGPGEIPGPYRNVIPNFIWRALHGEPLTITGTGDETRDFIFVDDLVDGLIRCAITPSAHSEAFNLGTGVQTRIRDLAQDIIELTESNSAIEYAPLRSWDHSVRRQGNIDKARRVLGFDPRVRVREGLRDTIRWFRQNESRISDSAMART